jgi:nucleotide-binding universal stress UspA family protein
MKNILVAVDFSDCSANALHYALSLAKYTENKIFLLHVYNLQKPVTDLFAFQENDSQKVEKRILSELKAWSAGTSKNSGYPGEINFIVRHGDNIHEINEVANENDIDLLIIGTHGKTSILYSFIGSTATELIREASCPLLLIPAGAPFHLPDSIAIAFDFSRMEDFKKLGIIRQLSRIISSRLEIFSVIVNEEEDVSEDNPLYTQVKRFMGSLPHNVHFNANPSIPDGIINFIGEHHSRMLVMFHHQHSILTDLFLSGNSRKIAFKVKIPLLIINQHATVSHAMVM